MGDRLEPIRGAPQGSCQLTTATGRGRAGACFTRATHRRVGEGGTSPLKRCLTSKLSNNRQHHAYLQVFLDRFST